MSQQTFEGTFTILATTDGYAGEFVTDAPRPMTMLEVDGASTTFEFEHPSMGKINVTGQVDESDVFAGTVTLGPNTAPIMATREAAVADAMAASAEAVEEVEHVLGTWAYKVTPPGDDPVEGTFTLEMGPDGLTGTFQTNAARTMRFIEVEGTRLAFEFDQPGMGTVLIRGNIRGDNFEGEARPETAMGAAPMTATRLPAEDTTNN
ncbi:MAG: hypothetical protein HKN04_00865 [Rhodothermaceae bacterium]|nr:hypothetical protein [Rhodothermaceae bacterium]